MLLACFETEAEVDAGLGAGGCHRFSSSSSEPERPPSSSERSFSSECRPESLDELPMSAPVDLARERPMARLKGRGGGGG